MKVMFASMDLRYSYLRTLFLGRYLLILSCSFLLLSFSFLDVAVSVSIEKFLEIFYLLA
jgi:hypothetical protein